MADGYTTRDIIKNKSLSSEENSDLIQKYHMTGDKNILDKIIIGNSGLVASRANYYAKRFNMEFDDLFQSGIFGLMEAIRKFDVDRGTTFSTCAAFWINHNIERFIDNCGCVIRIPVHRQVDIRKLSNCQKKLTMELGRVPTEEELAKEMGKPIDEIKRAMNLQPISLEGLKNTNGDDDDYVSIDSFAVDKKTSEASLKIDIDVDTHRLLVILKNILSPTQYYVIYYQVMFNDNKTKLVTISEKLGVDSAVLKQRKIRALNTIKSYLNPYSKKADAILKSYKDRKIDINTVRVTPLKGIDVLRYIYLMDELTSEERKLLYFELFGEVKYTKFTACRELNCTVSELDILSASLRNKERIKFADKSLFEEFSKKIIDRYGGLIYELDLFISTYTYENIEYDKLLGKFKEAGISLTTNNRDNLRRYCGCFHKPELPKREIEKDIYLSAFGYKNGSIGSRSNLNSDNIFEMLKGLNPNFFNLDTATADDVYEMISKYGDFLEIETKELLTIYYDIDKRIGNYSVSIKGALLLLRKLN